MRAVIVLLKLMQLPRDVLSSEAVEFFTAAPKPLVPHLIPKTKAPATRFAKYGAVCYFRFWGHLVSHTIPHRQVRVLFFFLVLLL